MIEIVVIAFQITLFYTSLSLGILLTEWACQRGAVMETYDQYRIRPRHTVIVVLSISCGIIASQIMWLAHVLCILIGLLLFKFYSQNSTPRILTVLLVANLVFAAGNYSVGKIAWLSKKLGEIVV